MKIKIYLLITMLFTMTLFSCEEDSEIESIIIDESSLDIEFLNAIPSKGGSRDLDFNSSTDWSISVNDTRTSSWISVEPSSGSAGDVLVKIVTSENTTTDDRQAKITIATGAVTQYINVFQKQKNALTVTSSRFEVPQSGGDIEVKIKANVDTDITIAESCKGWIREVATRSITTRSFSFEISPSEEAEVREGLITISGGELSEEVRVFQAGAKVLIINDKSPSVSSVGGRVTTEISSNFDFEVTMPDVDWIKESTTRAISSHTRYFDVSTNETHDARSAEILFKSNDGEVLDSVTISQEQRNAIKIDENIYNIESKAQNLPITLSSNVDVEVVIPESVTWISQASPTRGLTDTSFVLNITKNGHSARTAEVIFTNTKTSTSEIITINQAQSDAIVIGEKEYNLESNAQELLVVVSSNIDVEIEMPESVTWIRQAPKTRALTDKEFTLIIDGNIARNDRQVKIVFKNVTTSASDSISINQSGLGSEFDRQALITLYNATGGDMWENNTNWCSDKPIGEWYGVEISDGKLKSISLGQNNLVGAIPAAIWELTTLTSLSLYMNQLTGSIPAEIGNLTSLTWLSLGENQFRGSIPAEMGKLANLLTLDLGGNRFTGSIPVEISSLTDLKVLALDNNQLTGSIPAEIGGLIDLEFAHLQANRLTGSIPAKIVNWANIKGLSLSANMLSGTIPTAITEHVIWEKFWRSIISQQPSYGFDLTNVPIVGSKYILKDIKGKMFDCSKIYSQNEYTVLIDWSRDDAEGRELIRDLISFYKIKHIDGLEVIAYSWEDEDLYIREEGMDVWINFNRDENPDLYIHQTGRTSVQVEVVNQKGNIVFTQLGSALRSGEMFGNLSSDLLPFLEEKFSTALPPVYYESTDYSEDGKVLTLQSASVGSGINFVILGDGFSDRDMARDGKYEQRMREAMEHLFSEEPYKTYRNRYNVYCVKVVSKNEVYSRGAETAFRCAFGTGTAISGDHDKVFAYALKVPTIANTDNLTVLTILNSSRYAGTSYMYADNSSISYCPIVLDDDEEYRQVIIHEATGHGFAKLMDEYSYSGTLSYFDRYAYQYYRSINWAENIDVDNDPATIRWAHLLSDSRYDGLLGIYEGAFTVRYGAFRSTYESVMRNNTGGYNPPSREAIYKRIMKLSGEKYNYEEFVAYDAINRTSQTNALQRLQMPKVDMRKFVPLAPPVVIRSAPNVTK